MWKVHLEDLIRFGMPGYRMYVARVRHDGHTELITKPIVHSIENSQIVAPEDALLDDSGGFGTNVRNFLQAMSDAAWEIGIKPKQIEDNSNELKATKFHLEDMRTLVLKKHDPAP